jgi:CheY-like chemotaxis protein
MANNDPMNATANTPLPTPRTHDAIRALVVDDDQFQLELNADMLKDLGVSNVTTAASGELALKAVGNAKGSGGFNLMFCDLYMPGMDGFQFMEAVARNGFAGSLIIVSGQGPEVMRSASLVAQLRRFKLVGTLEKPVKKTELSALLSRLIS